MPTKPPAQPPTPAEGSDVPPAYEDALAELEALVMQMETGQLALDDLMAVYQRGARLLAVCRERLDAVEQQVKLLDEGGTKPWTPAP